MDLIHSISLSLTVLLSNFIIIKPIVDLHAQNKILFLGSPLDVPYFEKILLIFLFFKNKV